MSFKAFGEFCVSCCGRGESTEAKNSRKSRYCSASDMYLLAVYDFCPAAFLPECARKIAHHIKINKELSIPMAVKHQVIFLTCETPAIPDIIDLYTINHNFGIVDIVDELNFHLTGIMKRLTAEGGDIVNAQDGFLECIWPLNKEEENKLIYTKVLHAAMAVQEEFGATQTKLGVKMTNKIAIMDGYIYVIFSGSERVLCTVAGEVMKDARKSMSLLGKSKEVVVTDSFWENVEKKKYIYKQHEEHYIQVLSTTEKLKEINEEICEKLHKELQIFNDIIGDDIYKYLHPLHKNARTSQQLHILTSMSQVVYVAVRLKDLDVRDVDELQKAIDVVEATTKEFEGIFTKLVYRMDLTICIVFGVPGFKHKDDAVRSILCSQKILKSLGDIGRKVSIGISAGMVFCGILGPANRLEYCVIGMAVQIALRLVDLFPEEELICDINTYFRTCRFLGDIFFPLKRRLKGIKILSLMFRVCFSETKKIPPVNCVGRRKEKEMIGEALKQLKDGMDSLEKLLPLINIKGKLGTGKSTLLSWAMQEGQKLGYRITVRITNTTFEEPNGNAWSILKQVLAKRLVDDERKILEILGGSASRFPLYLLNKRLNTNFPEPVIPLDMGNVRDMMVQIVINCAQGEPILVGLDNAEHTGTETWFFLQSLLLNKVAVVVTTFTEEFNICVPFVRHLVTQQYLGLNLGPTDESELGSLACNVLNVRAIHKGFLDFLQKECGGNALQLQEILMLPPLQKHFCIVSFTGISESRLEQDFVQAEEDEIDPSIDKACDILDQEGLLGIKIPKHLLDIVKDHTTGLNPEEQMLMRKCSLFGESFGLRILETVCPEYNNEELYEKVKSLAKKNILMSVCEHWLSGDTTDSRKISLSTIPIDYCLHPIRFKSCFLKKCVLNSMTDSQRDRLHLYLADLLVADSNRSCDACRRQIAIAPAKSESEDMFAPLKDYKIPKIDFRLCQCLNLHTDILIEVEYHLEKGKSPLQKRIDILLQAAETGLKAGKVSKVEDLLNKCKRLKNWLDDEIKVYEDSEPDYVRVAIERLRAKVKIYLGKRNDSLRRIKQAMLLMNIVFPADIKLKKYKGLRNEGELGIEECRCLSLGCFILMTLGKYEDATEVGKQYLKAVAKVDPETCTQIDARVLYLKALSKSEPSRKRERELRKLINLIRQQCSKRLLVCPILDIEELRIIIRAFKTLVQVLFEKAELDAANEIGRKSFQILNIVHDPKQLVRVLYALTNIAYYQKDYRRCTEMISQLQDAYQQSGDVISEAMYYTALSRFLITRVLMKTRVSIAREDQVQMCDDYAERGGVNISFHPKHTNRFFCHCSTMALWCVERRLKDAFVLWYDQALILQKQVTENNYNTVNGMIYLKMADIRRVQKEFFVFTSSEIGAFKREMNKTLEDIQKQVKNFFPILQRDLKRLECRLKNTFNECNVLKDDFNVEN